jgi:RHH-type proline utilization regulon transcriptional repressor/proline dehydrogenase/delta 1-pyrroline-5-carboxylate dehydrogenase
MANIFITGTDGESAFPNLQQIWKEGARFTVDILGEAVVSDREADEYAGRYRALLDFLADATSQWKPKEPLATNEPPLVNVSVKLSALCARVQAADPDQSIGTILRRLRPIVSRARELGAFINLDMEHYGLKQLTVDLFKQLEEEFSGYSQLGLVIQAYLRDSLADAEELLKWSRSTGRNFTIRLVKGAYWDFEKVIAAQRTWKVPVYLAKPETDANYERITRLVLENHETVYPAFASHTQHCARDGVCRETRSASRRLRVSDAVRHGDPGASGSGGTWPSRPRVLSNRKTCSWHGVFGETPSGEYFQ